MTIVAASPEEAAVTELLAVLAELRQLSTRRQALLASLAVELEAFLRPAAGS